MVPLATASAGPAAWPEPHNGERVAQIVISGFDDALLNRLRVRALLAGRSLDQEVEAILRSAAELSPADRDALLDQVGALTLGTPRDAGSLQREERDR